MPVLTEVDLPYAFTTRPDAVGQLAGARLLRAGTYTLSGGLPAAVTGTDPLLDRLKARGPPGTCPARSDRAVDFERPGSDGKVRLECRGQRSRRIRACGRMTA